MSKESQANEMIEFDTEKNAFIIPKAMMEEILSVIDQLAPENFISEPSYNDSDDTSSVEETSLAFPGNRSYCCEFTIAANGPVGEQRRESFRSFPGLAQVRCAAIALQYGQTSSYARRGSC